MRNFNREMLLLESLTSLPADWLRAWADSQGRRVEAVATVLNKVNLEALPGGTVAAVDRVSSRAWFLGEIA